MLHQHTQDLAECSETPEIIGCPHTDEQSDYQVARRTVYPQPSCRLRDEGSRAAELREWGVDNERARKLHHRGRAYVCIACRSTHPRMRNFWTEQREIARFERLHIFAYESEANTRFDPCEFEVVVAMPRRRKAGSFEPQESKRCCGMCDVLPDNSHCPIVPCSGSESSQYWLFRRYFETDGPVILASTTHFFCTHGMLGCD